MNSRIQIFSRSTIRVTLLLGFVLFACAVQVQSVQHMIEVFGDADDNPGEGKRYVDKQSPVASFFRTASKVCISGGWALYSKPNYGQNDVDNPDLVVYVAQSLSPSGKDCDSTPAAQSILKNTYSVRPLWGGVLGIQLFPFKNFLSNLESQILLMTGSEIDPSLLAKTAYKSFVIADVGAPALPALNNYIVCGQGSNCICVNAMNNPLVVRDITQFPRSKPLRRLSRVEWAGTTDLQTECLTYPNPSA